MAMRGKLWWGGLGVLIVAAVTIVMLRAPATVKASAEPATVTANAEGSARPAESVAAGKPAAAPQQPQQPARREPREITRFDEKPSARVSTLRPLAEAGDLDAMRELGEVYADCRQWIDDTDESMQRKVLDSFERQFKRLPAGDADRAKIDRHYREFASRRDRCRELTREDIDKATDWLEKAARAGDTGAAVDYVESAFVDFRTSQDLLVRLDEVVHRRDVARELLKAILDRGDCTALHVYAAAYNADPSDLAGIFPRDIASSLAYEWAAMLHTATLIPQEEAADQREGMEDKVKNLTAEQRRDMTTRGQKLFDTYCRVAH